MTPCCTASMSTTNWCRRTERPLDGSQHWGLRSTAATHQTLLIHVSEHCHEQRGVLWSYVWLSALLAQAFCFRGRLVGHWGDFWNNFFCWDNLLITFISYFNIDILINSPGCVKGASLSALLTFFISMFKKVAQKTQLAFCIFSQQQEEPCVEEACCRYQSFSLKPMTSHQLAALTV